MLFKVFKIMDFKNLQTARDYKSDSETLSIQKSYTSYKAGADLEFIWALVEFRVRLFFLKAVVKIYPFPILCWMSKGENI